MPVAWMISHWPDMGGLYLVQPFVTGPDGELTLSQARLVASSLDCAHELLPRRAGLRKAPNHRDFPSAVKTYVVRGAA